MVLQSSLMSSYILLNNMDCDCFLEMNYTHPCVCVCVFVKVAQSSPTLCNPMDYTVHGLLQARILVWVAFTFTNGSSNPGIEPRLPTLQADSLPAVPQGKPKNTGVGSLSLLQQIFLTQESNQGF